MYSNCKLLKEINHAKMLTIWVMRRKARESLATPWNNTGPSIAISLVETEMAAVDWILDAAVSWEEAAKQKWLRIHVLELQITEGNKSCKDAHHLSHETKSQGVLGNALE
jgi:hypothetical protein